MNRTHLLRHISSHIQHTDQGRISFIALAQDGLAEANCAARGIVSVIVDLPSANQTRTAKRNITS